MRTFTTEHTVYNFDELKPEAKDKALQYFRDHEEFYFLSEDLEYKLEELLKAAGITYTDKPKIYYSLSWSQGDGAMFEGTVYWKAWRADINQSGHYYHYNSKNFTLTSVKTDAEAPEATDNKFNEVYVDICQELEKYGYAQMDYLLSEECIVENIQANEYEFYEDGRLA